MDNGMNSHGFADMTAEVQAICWDLLPQAIGDCTLAVPVPPSLTLSAFRTGGYVRQAQRLVYTHQSEHSIALSGSNGTYWLALHVDTWTPVTGWTRQPGTHYLWQSAATQPAGSEGLLVFASVTVAGNVVTQVTGVADVFGTSASWRTWLGLGTMAVQQASAVAITGGTATLSSAAVTSLGVGRTADANYTLVVAGDRPAYLGGALTCLGDAYFAAHAGIGAAPLPGQYHLNAGSVQAYSLGVVSSLATNTLTSSGWATISGTLTAQTAFAVGGRTDLLGLLDVSGGTQLRGQTAVSANPASDFAFSVYPGMTYANGLCVGVSFGNAVSGRIVVGENGFKPGGGSWGDAFSTHTLKRNIRPIPDALRSLLALQGRAWEWRAEQVDLERLLPGTRQGFVIEEVAHVQPQWVHQPPGAPPALTLYGFEAFTVEALREIVTRLEALEGAV
jgi:hypothetical protein